MRNNLAKEVSEELEKYFPSLVFNTLIPRNVKLAEAPSHGVSAIQYMPSSFGAKAYLALAGELIRRISTVADKILSTGLDALLGDVTKVNQQTIKELDLYQIKPNRFQPRQSFDEDKINELSLSIAKHGVLSPILVRETGAGGYELIAGERRLRAAKKTGLKTLPCLIDSAEDQTSLELALIENLQREDLNPIEEARGYDRLKREFNLTQDNISEVTGKARSSVANSYEAIKPSPINY